VKGNKKILVTGSNGQLGSDLRRISPAFNDYYFSFTDAAELDITDFSTLNACIRQNKFDFIINCAAYTGVDRAEDEKEMAGKINTEGPKNLSLAIENLNTKLIHISTDYIFDGTSHIPYSEDMEANPTGAYGFTKLKGEEEICKRKTKGIIIRTSWLYSSFGNNFVKTMLRLGKEREELNVVYDQIGSPTYAGDLANAIMNIIPLLDDEHAEIFHFANEGVCSWFDLAKTIFENQSTYCIVNPILTEQYPTKAKRPHYSVFDKVKIKSTYNLSIPYWKDSLNKCLELIKNGQT
jgi:dTDP-4-dehydrorhamnose reductase